MAIVQKQSIPALRFPEFRNEWISGDLKEYIFRVGRQVEVKANEFYKEIGIRSHGKGLFHKELILGKTLGNKRVFEIYIPALVLNIVFAWEHAVALTSDAEKGFIASHRFPMYIPLDDNSDLLFVLYYFLRKRGKYLLGLASPGGAGRNKTLGQKEFLNLNVIFPEIREQKKIANFLSSVDTKIELLKKKKVLWEQYKKGMMQKLFSQEIRFKDENQKDYPDWDNKYFKEIYSFISTNSFSREKLNYESGDVRNIHYGDIHTKYRLRFILTNEDVPFINEDIKLNSNYKNSLCMKGDLIIADASEDYGDIGKSIEIIDLKGEKVLAGLHTLHAKLESTNMFIGFACYLMSSRDIKHQIMTIAQGAKVLGISPNRVKNIKLQIPEKGEQKKIANFLTAIDNKIEHIDNEINQTQVFKKGLLQKMFV